MDVSNADLLFGVAATIVACSIIGISLNVYRNLDHQEERFYKPQSVRLYTGEAPAQIELIARRARQRRFWLNLGLFVVCCMGLDFVAPNIAQQFLLVIVSVLDFVLSCLHEIIFQLLIQLR